MIRRRVFIVLGTPFALITALIGCGMLAIGTYVTDVVDVMSDWFGNWRGGVTGDNVTDAPTWNVGDRFEVVGNRYRPRHNFNIGTVVELVSIGQNGLDNFYRNDAGTKQFVDVKDLRKL